MTFNKANKLHDLNNWENLALGIFRYRLTDHVSVEIILSGPLDISKESSIYYAQSQLFTVNQITDTEFKRSPFSNWNDNYNNVFENIHKAVALALKIEEE